MASGAVGKAYIVGDFSAFRRELLRTQKSTKTFQSDMGGVGRSLKSFGSKAIIGGAVIGVAALTAGLVKGAIAGLKYNSSIEQTTIAMGTMLGSTDKAKKLIGEITKMAAQTPFEFPELADSAKRLVAFGVEQKKVVDTMRRLGDVASGLNIPMGELADIYGKVRVQGRLFAEDVNQFAGRGIPIYEYLAKVLGVNESKVKDLVSAGKVGFPELEKAFKLMTDEGGKFGGMMDKQSKSFAGQWSTIKDGINEAFGKALKPFFDWLTKEAMPGVIAHMPQIKAAFMDVSKWLNETIMPALRSAADWLGKLADDAKVNGWMQAFRDNIPMFKDFEKTIRDVFEWVKENGPGAWRWLKENIPKIVKAYEDLEDGINGVREALGQSVEPTKKETSNLGKLREIIVKMVVPFAAFIEIVKGLSTQLNKLGIVGESSRAALVVAWTSLKRSASTLWGGIVTSIKNSKDSIIRYLNAIITAVNQVFARLHINKKIDLIGDDSRRSSGGTFDSSSGGASTKAASSRVSTPPLMDNGGTGADGTGGGVVGAIGDWAKSMLGGLGVKWPGNPGGLFGDASGWLLGAIKDAVIEIIRKSGGPGRQIVEIAKTMLGVPYLWGGTGPGGFDCSGLIYWAYKQAGFNIDRTGMWNSGRRVTPATARPADVLFYTAGGPAQGVKYGHVKMYAGGGQTIESTRGGVQMRPADWGGAGEVRTYLAKGGVIIGGESGAEAVLPLEDSRAKAQMQAAGIGAFTYIDRSQANFYFPPGLSRAEYEALANRQIQKWEGRRAQAVKDAQRGRVR